MKKLFAILLVLCMALALMPTAAFAASDGWQTDSEGYWQYYQNGRPLTGVQWIEALGHRYIFSNNGYLRRPDSEGDLVANGNLYYMNPDWNPADPSSCYVVHDYTRVHGKDIYGNDIGITYYDLDSISFTGWIKDAASGSMRYQTRIKKENIPGATKDRYIFVWRAQYLEACQHPDYPGDMSHRMPAGWYLFGDDGVWISADGVYPCNDGHTYRVSGGRIVAKDGAGVTPPTPTPTPTPTPSPSGNSLEAYFQNNPALRAEFDRVVANNTTSDQKVSYTVSGNTLTLTYQWLDTSIDYSLAASYVQAVLDDPSSESSSLGRQLAWACDSDTQQAPGTCVVVYRYLDPYGNVFAQKAYRNA